MRRLTWVRIVPLFLSALLVMCSIAVAAGDVPKDDTATHDKALLGVVDKSDVAVATADAQLSSLAALLADLRKGLNTQYEEVARLTAEVQRLVGENKDLKATLNTRTQERDNASKMLEELRERYEELKVVAGDAEENADQLDSALLLIATYEDAIARLEARVAQLETGQN